MGDDKHRVNALTAQLNREPNCKVPMRSVISQPMLGRVDAPRCSLSVVSSPKCFAS